MVYVIMYFVFVFQIIMYIKFIADILSNSFVLVEWTAKNKKACSIEYKIDMRYYRYIGCDQWFQ